MLQSSDEQSGCSDDFCKGQACWQSRCWARQRSKRTDSCRTCRASVWLPLQACRREHGRAATKCRQCRPTADAGFPAHSFSGAAKGGFMLRGGRATTLALLSSDAGRARAVARTGSFWGHDMPQPAPNRPVHLVSGLEPSLRLAGPRKSSGQKHSHEQVHWIW